MHMADALLSPGTAATMYAASAAATIFAGYSLIWRPIQRSNLFSRRTSRSGQRLCIILASILGCVITLQMGAFLGLMLPIHLAIGLIEGLITSFDLDMILDTCDTVILLNHGTVVKSGPAEEILPDKELLESCRLELPLSALGRQ